MFGKLPNQTKIKVISGYECNSSPSLLIQCNHHFYLFNAPPLVFSKLSLLNISVNKIKHTFCTKAFPSATNGFIETTDFKKLFLDEISVNITGPKDIDETIFQGNGISITKFLWNITDKYANDYMKVNSIHMSKSFSYDITLFKKGNLNYEIFQKHNETHNKYVWNLSSGKNVTLDDGFVVTPNDFFKIEEIHILIVDCIDLNDLNLLPEDLSKYACIIHFTTPELYTDKYLNFFNSNSYNYYFGDSQILNNLVSANYQQYELENLIFPLTIENTNEHLGNGFIPIKKGEEYCFINNHFELDENTKVPVRSCYINELPKFNSFAVTVLGSIAGSLTKEYFTSGYLLHTINGFIAIDTGEGFIERVTQKYGRENVKKILLDLKAIYISHRHYDHINGLLNLLIARSLLTSNKAYLCADKIILNEIQMKEKYLYHKGYFNLIYKDRIEPITIEDGMIIRSCPVLHCEDSMGCIFTLSNGYKIAFSGDRNFTDNSFVDFLGNDIDLLIHESTYYETELESAMLYNHSTFSHAIETGKKANAKFILLSHFSQRYKRKIFSPLPNNCLCAFEYLSFTFDNIIDIIKTCQIKHASNKDVNKDKN